MHTVVFTMLNVTNDRLSLVKAFEKTRKIELLLTGSFGYVSFIGIVHVQILTHVMNVKKTSDYWTKHCSYQHIMLVMNRHSL